MLLAGGGGGGGDGTKIHDVWVLKYFQAKTRILLLTAKFGYFSTTVLKLKVPGKSCHSFQPEVSVKDGKVTYLLNKSLMFDLVQYLGQDISMIESQSSLPTNAQTASKDPALKQCFVCPSKIALEKMKIHVGKHILNGNCKNRYPWILWMRVLPK